MKLNIGVSLLVLGLLSGHAFAMEKGERDAGRPSVEVKYKVYVDGKVTEIPNILGITGADFFHKKGYTGEGLKALVLDKFLDMNHDAFKSYLSNSSIPDLIGDPKITKKDSHGTHVAGLLAQMTRAQIKFNTLYDGDGDYSHSLLCDTLKGYARAGGDVINISHGIIVTKEVQERLQEVVESGKAVFIALGNGHVPGQSSEAQAFINLAAMKEMKGRIVLVSNLQYDKNNKERLAPSSMRGSSKNAIATVGSDVFSTTADNQWGIMSGTSMASPIAAGAYLLLKSTFPGFQPEDYIKLLKDSARKKSLNDSYTFGPEYGCGVLDLRKAYDLGVERYGDPYYLREFHQKLQMQNNPSNQNKNEGENSSQEKPIIETPVKEEEKVVSSVPRSGSLLSRKLIPTKKK